MLGPQEAVSFYSVLELHDFYAAILIFYDFP